MTPLQCIAITASGQPVHPVRAKYTSAPISLAGVFA